MKKIRDYLINDWHLAWRFWSMRVDAFGVAFASVFLAFPSLAVDVWNNFPADLKTYIPQQWTPYISIGLLGLSIVVRVVKQRKLEAIRNDSAKPVGTGENQ